MPLLKSFTELDSVRNTYVVAIAILNMKTYLARQLVQP
jgi:hypothetical protein